MPITKGQGQSESTEAKERGLGAAFATNLRIWTGWYSKNQWAKNARYFHFDLNCGSGYNIESDCIGSPLAFLREAARLGVAKYHAHFVDIDGETIKQLLAREEVTNDPRCFLHHGDNELFPDAIPEIIRGCREKAEMAIGSILCDPNGTEIPLKSLARLAKSCPRLDIFINWNSAAFKRQQGASGSLIDMLNTIRKEHWLIRQPIGKHQWTLLLGRNYDVGDHKALGFVALNSPEGRAIRDRCHFTSEELDEQAMAAQMRLFK